MKQTLVATVRDPKGKAVKVKGVATLGGVSVGKFSAKPVVALPSECGVVLPSGRLFAGNAKFKFPTPGMLKM